MQPTAQLEPEFGMWDTSAQAQLTPAHSTPQPRSTNTVKEPSRSLGYKVLYNLDREAAYDLREADTPYKVGEILREELKEWQELSPEEFEQCIGEFADPDGRFYYFAQLHGWYEQLAQAKACFDLKKQRTSGSLRPAYSSLSLLSLLGCHTYLYAGGWYRTDGWYQFRETDASPTLAGCYASWLSESVDVRILPRRPPQEF